MLVPLPRTHRQGGKLRWPDPGGGVLVARTGRRAFLNSPVAELLARGDCSPDRARARWGIFSHSWAGLSRRGGARSHRGRCVCCRAHHTRAFHLPSMNTRDQPMVAGVIPVPGHAARATSCDLYQAEQARHGDPDLPGASVIREVEPRDAPGGKSLLGPPMVADARRGGDSRGMPPRLWQRRRSDARQWILKGVGDDPWPRVNPRKFVALEAWTR